MSPRTQRRWIYTSAILCLIAAGGLWTWGCWPVAPPAVSFQARTIQRSRSALLTEAPPLAELQKLADTRLRRPLVDPPPEPQKSPVIPKKAPKPVVSRPPRIEQRLIGTVLEAGKSTAIFIDRAGNIDLKEEGDELDGAPAGARIVHIELNAVTVSFGDRQLTLAMPKQEVLR